MSFAERLAALPPLGVGLGFRGPLAALFGRGGSSGAPDPIGCVEVVAEHFFDPVATRPIRKPAVLGERPVLLHSLDLSLGTPGPWDEAYVAELCRVADGLDAALLSDHLAFTRTAELELGHLNPVPPTRAQRDAIAEKIRALQERSGRLFLLENITTHLRLPSELSFAEFYAGVCERADCGMLFDVTNLYVVARNLGREPLEVLDALDLSRVVQLHVVGFTEQAGRLFDTHVADIQPAIYDLTAAVLERAPVRAVIVERDGHYPDPDVLLAQLERLDRLFQASVSARVSETEARTPKSNAPAGELSKRESAEPVGDPREGLSLVTALGRLLTDPGARATFREDREPWIESLPLSEGERTLRDLDADELAVQAQVLVDKRCGETLDRLPRTRARAGDDALRESFQRYAPTGWPRGHLRHLHDALGFLAWLREDLPQAPHSLDEAFLRAQLARREGRLGAAGLAHHPDLWFTRAYLALATRRRRYRFALPLPLPAALGRRLAW